MMRHVATVLASALSACAHKVAFNGTRAARPLLALAVLAVASPALANNIRSANVTPDCTGFTLSVAGSNVEALPAFVKFQIILTPLTPGLPSFTINSSDLLAVDAAGNFAQSEAHTWAEFGVPPLADGYSLSGTATLLTNNLVWNTVDIVFTPATLECPCNGAIGDFVWLDANMNGIQDAGEPGIPGVQVNLTGAGIGLMAITDLTGHYMFTGLCPGTYEVTVTPPANHIPSPVEAGTDRSIDSNPNPSTVVLTKDNPIDLTNDWGFFSPCSGSIGDFVWNDLNANGIQDAGEPGIPNVHLLLLDPSFGSLLGSTFTDGSGHYLFPNLCPGMYEVVVITPTGFSATGPLAGLDRARDSNPNPDLVVLTPQVPSDLTIDFGFIKCPPRCTGVIGDFVWEDLNANGIQDLGEPGIPGVALSLHAGGPLGPVVATTATIGNGFYLFTGLCAGAYTVVVDTPPAGSVPSPCMCAGAPLGLCNIANDNNCSPASVLLPTDNSSDYTIDFGYMMPPPCPLSVNKTCESAPVTSEWASCKGKLQQFSVIWPSDQGTITISGIPNDAPGGVVHPGQRVTFNGPFAVNDLYLNISGAVTGRSTFHVSCSDKDMDGLTATNLEQQQLPGRSQDCGKFEGNGKALSGTWINVWLLDDLVDAEGKVLECSTVTEPSSSCTVQERAPLACGPGISFKPMTLTFKYTGGGCSTESNNQAADKTSCSGMINPALPVNITFPGGTALNVPPGGTFTMPRTQAQSLITLTNAGGTESDSIHTSCSQPLAVGDVYFSLTLVGEDSMGAGQDVTYNYAITNNGAFPVTGVVVVDDKLGALPGSPIASIAPGQTVTLSASALIEETTTNTVTVSALACPAGVTDSATVTVVPPPPCTLTSKVASLADDKIVFAVKNTSSKVVTLDTLTLNFPAQRLAIKEVQLDGSIYKSDMSSLFVGPGVTIGSTNWTNPDISKRQLNPGEMRNLTIIFKAKYKSTASAFSGVATFREGCSLNL